MTCLTFFRRLNNSSHWRSRAMSAFLTITPGSLADSTSTTSSWRNPSSKVGSHIIASFVKDLWPPHSLFPINKYDTRIGMIPQRCAFLAARKKWNQKFQFDLLVRIGVAQFAGNFQFAPEKMARGRWRGGGWGVEGQLNIFFLQNNFLHFWLFPSRPLHKTPLFISGIMRTGWSVHGVQICAKNTCFSFSVTRAIEVMWV